MKKFLSLFIAAAIAFSAVSCGASRKLATITEGQQEVNLVFTGSDYQSDKHYFRDNGTGVSKDLSNAKKIAVQNARQSIAAMVQSAVKVLVDNYATTQNAESSFLTDGNDLEELGRTVVDTQLSGLVIQDEKAFRLPDGSYRYHVCMKLDKDNLVKAMADAMDKTTHVKLRANKDAFRAYFEEKIR